MTHSLRNPNDRKYFGHNIHKPKKWVTTTKRKIKKLPMKKAAGPVELNPKYIEWKEKQKDILRKTRYDDKFRHSKLRQKKKAID